MSEWTDTLVPFLNDDARVFVVGHLGADWRYPASVLFEPDCLPRDTPPRRRTGAGVAKSVTASTGGASGKEQQLDFVGGNGRPLNAIESGHGFYSESDVAQTIEAQEDQHRRNILCMATGQGGAETSEDCAVNLTCNHEAPIIGAFMPGQGAKEDVAYTQNCTGVMGVSQNETVRRLTPVECERLMGFPDNCMVLRGGLCLLLRKEVEQRTPRVVVMAKDERE